MLTATLSGGYDDANFIGEKTEPLWYGARSPGHKAVRWLRQERARVSGPNLK